jgi:intracellular sulfur oxidation DsrE/DsrF family protein
VAVDRSTKTKGDQYFINPHNTAILHRLKSQSFEKTLKKIWPNGVGDIPDGVALLAAAKLRLEKYRERQITRLMKKCKNEGFKPGSVQYRKALDSIKSAMDTAEDIEYHDLTAALKRTPGHVEGLFESTGSKYVPQHYPDPSGEHTAEHTWARNRAWLDHMQKFPKAALTDLPLSAANLMRQTPGNEMSFSAYAREIAFLLAENYRSGNQAPTAHAGVDVQFLRKTLDPLRISEDDLNTLRAVADQPGSDDSPHQVSLDQLLAVFRRQNLRVADTPPPTNAASSSGPGGPLASHGPDGAANAPDTPVTAPANGEAVR